MSELYDIAIVGAGIAGMTAAIYGARAGKKVLLLEQKIPGGQIVTSHDVRNWPGEERISGADLSEQIYHQVNNFNVKTAYDAIKSAKYSSNEYHLQGDDDTYHARTLILAVGSKDRPLGVENEERLVGHGISYCATCDGALYKDKDVLVVGGGNTAMYDVLYLANLARKVYLMHRRDQFRADAVLVEKVKKLQNVELIMSATPEVLDDGAKVTGFRAISTVEHPNEDAAPQAATTPVDGIFVAIGRVPATEAFADLVELDEAGYVKAGEDCKTSHPGVFAAGDCRTKGLRQLVTAAADGAVAASAAAEYLRI